MIYSNSFHRDEDEDVDVECKSWFNIAQNWVCCSLGYMQCIHVLVQKILE